jgi:hypothetical protein
MPDPFNTPLGRWALTLSKFSDCPDEQNFAAVCTPDGGVAKLTYGDARAVLRDLLATQDRLGRIASWHALETGPGGMVGLYCIECGNAHPCETRRMADGTHEDLKTDPAVPQEERSTDE